MTSSKPGWKESKDENTSVGQGCGTEPEPQHQGLVFSWEIFQGSFNPKPLILETVKRLPQFAWVSLQLLPIPEFTKEK